MKKNLHNKALYAIVDISKLVTSSRNFFEIKDEIVEKMLEVIPPNKACINIFEPQNYKDAFLVCHQTLMSIPDFFQDCITDNGIKIPFHMYPRYIRESVETRRSIYIEDLEKDERAADEHEFAKMEGYSGRAVFPFISGDKVLGFMTCFLSKDEKLTSEDMNFLDSVASFLGMSIEITRHNGDLDRIISGLRNTINSISRATDELYRNKDINSFLSMISEQACRFTGSEASFVFVEDHDERIYAAANYGEFQPMTAVLEFVVKHKNLGLEEKSFTTATLPQMLIDAGVRSLVYENLIHEEKNVGSLIVINSKKYNTDDMKILSIYASQIALSLMMYLDSRKLFDKQLIERDLDIIAKQQQLIMSDRHLKLQNGATIDYHHSPSKQIGGDFCKIARIDGHKAIVFIADVMGHGILSNYFVAMMKGVLKTLLYENLWPNEILNRLNSILFQDLDALNLFITARIVMIDTEQEILISANAGHPLPIVLHKDGKSSQHFFENEGGIPIGVMEDNEYEQRIYDISKLNLVALYTDGVIETTNPEGEEFGTEGLGRFLEREQEQTGQVICDSIESELQSFSKLDTMKDDAMLVIIRRG